MDRGTALHQEMARIEDQLKLMDSPSAPVVPDEAVNAGRPIPAHAQGVSSKSAWKEERDDPKGVIGVCLENENEIELIPERNPIEEVKKEIMRRAQQLSFYPTRRKDISISIRSIGACQPTAQGRSTKQDEFDR